MLFTHLKTISIVHRFIFSDCSLILFKVFTRPQEEALAIYLKECQAHYYGLSTAELKRLAYELAVKLKIKFPPAWEIDATAGWKWYYNSMARHPEFVLRTPEQTSLNRVRGFCKENVAAFFRNLCCVLTPEQ